MIGYAVPILPDLASFRLRVAIPAPHTGFPYVIGDTGKVSFFFKSGDPELAQTCGPVVYDVVNDHFSGKHSESYRAMCSIADVVTCASPAMAEQIRAATGKQAIVIDDPYEHAEQEAKCEGDAVLWFGHSANIQSLGPYTYLPSLVVCTNLPGCVQWSPAAERGCLDECAVVLLTGCNHGASSNRMVKAIRAGRFVVTPGGVPSWDAFKEFAWVGDVQQGIEWALNNREEACRKVKAGQEWIRERFSPQTIGSQWRRVFATLISAQETRQKKAG